MEAKFSVIVKDIIQYSREDALKNKDIEIHPEHIMLGIITSGPENSAFNILAYLGVNIQNLHLLIIDSLIPFKKNTRALHKSIPLTIEAEKVIKVSYLEAKILRTDIK